MNAHPEVVASAHCNPSVGEVLLPFSKIWLVDFEFGNRPGEQVEPVCLVARELRSGRTVRLWQDELLAAAGPPYEVDGDALFVAFYASAEVACHLALGWLVPRNIVDLFVEFRCQTNGQRLPAGAGLLGALVAHGLDAMEAVEKDEMRQLALRGGPWTNKESAALLHYCEADVDALGRLLPAMAGGLDLPRALVRGRYMASVARMEAAGVPIDLPMLLRLRAAWPGLKLRIIEEVDQDYGVFNGTAFSMVKFGSWLANRGIPWPLTDSGRLRLDKETFALMALRYPELEPLRQLRSAVAKLRVAEVEVGQDGRNRTMLRPFQAKTGRNQPSTSRFIFGPARWFRSLIKPEEGRSLCYIDYGQQEFGIAAALSGDTAMLAAYHSGDPYLAFARQAGAVPPDATAATHPVERKRFKECALGVQYGIGAASLGLRLGIGQAQARDLLRLHRRTYPVFWAWSDRVVDHATLRRELHTTLGWRLAVRGRPGGTDCGGWAPPNPRSLRNFPMQANGAEILRLACIAATEAGIAVVAPVHDALLIEAATEAIHGVAQTTCRIMELAAAAVLGGTQLRTDASFVHYPDRFIDEGGQHMWQLVMRLLRELE